MHPQFLLGCVDELRVATDTDDVANDESRTSAGPNPLVMPVYVETLLFAAHVERGPAAAGLDLCTGSGVHALLLASHCTRVVGTDISPRAIDIARFNARLNGVDNVEFLPGALWSPVADERFDVITANPPYQPEPQGVAGTNWWGAQARGEGVWRPLVEQLHEHLTPGGCGHIILQGLSWDGDRSCRACARTPPTLAVEFDRFGAPGSLALSRALPRPHRTPRCARRGRLRRAAAASRGANPGGFMKRLFLSLIALGACSNPAASPRGAVSVPGRVASERTVEPVGDVPRTWDPARTESWLLPLAHQGLMHQHPSAEYFYSLPDRPIYRSYPVYHPDAEPEGYRKFLETVDPEVIWDAEGTKPPLDTPEDWIRAGELVYDTAVDATQGGFWVSRFARPRVARSVPRARGQGRDGADASLHHPRAWRR